MSNLVIARKAEPDVAIQSVKWIATIFFENLAMTTE
jgi:hypothetical protein